MNRRNAAFTLIELLVVITVIGILISLVFVSAQNVIRKGNETRALNNLRQTAAGLLLYAADHDGRIPGRAADGTGEDRWPKLLIAGGYITDSKVFAAPDDPSNFLRTKRNVQDNGQNNSSYIVNGGEDPGGASGGGSGSPPLALAAVDQLSKTILVGVVYNDGNFYLDVDQGDEPRLIKPALFGTTNVYAFMDGSARFLAAEDYRKQNTEAGSAAYLWLIHKP